MVAVSVFFACLTAGQVSAAEGSTPSLVISQLKITSSNGQFITLYNATSTAIDLSRYQLQYFNHYDLSKATSSRLISLAGVVPPHGFVIVNDSTIQLCYQLVVNSASLGLSSTAGMIQVLGYSQVSSGGSANPVLQDYVAWTKTASPGVQTLPSSQNAFLQRLPRTTENFPNVIEPGYGTWQAVQPNPENSCSLVALTSSDTPTLVPTGLNVLLPTVEPEAIFETVQLNSTIAHPTSNGGLMKPAITELLPNPAGSGTDSVDEFIEIYNPNDTAFNLGGYYLQTGTSSTRTYTFPAGATLQPKSFTAFYALTTGLSLSNTGSQAKLLDPSGAVITESLPYGSAADGHSWSLANGGWHWSTKPTPGATNVISRPIQSKAPARTGKVKGSTKSAAKPAKIANPKRAQNSATAYTDKKPSTPIHPGVLALVGSGALLYGAYEYRSDLGNRIHQLRRHLKARRTNRL